MSCAVSRMPLLLPFCELEVVSATGLEESPLRKSIAKLLVQPFLLVVHPNITNLRTGTGTMPWIQLARKLYSQQRAVATHVTVACVQADIAP